MNRTRVVIALGVSQTLAWGSTYYLPAILAVPMARGLGLTTGTVFSAFSSALVVSALLGPFAGRCIDRFGGRDVLAVSSLMFALGLLVLGLATGPALLWLGWLIIGTGMGMGLYEAAFSTLAGLYGREARSPITGITLLAGFASTICWPITGWLNVELGWQGTCLTWAVIHLLLGLPINRLLIPLGAQPKVDEKAVNANASAADASAWLTMSLLAFVFAVTWFVSTGMAAHLPWLLQISGLSPTAAIAAAALVGPAQVLARLLEFSLLQRFHPLLSAKLATVAHPLGALGVMALGAPVAFIFVLLHGAGNGILTIAKGTLPLAIFGPQGYGLRQGVLMVPARFGQALAPLTFSLLIEHYGTYALWFSTVLGLAALGALHMLQRHTAGDRHEAENPY